MGLSSSPSAASQPLPLRTLPIVERRGPLGFRLRTRRSTPPSRATPFCSSSARSSPAKESAAAALAAPRLHRHRHRRHLLHRRRRHRRRHRLHCRCRRQRDGSADKRLRLHDFFSAGQLGSQFFKGLNAWRPARRAAPLAPAQDLFKPGSRMQPANADSTKTSPRIISTRTRASLLVSLMRHPRPRAAAAGDAPSEKRLRCRA